MHATELHTVIQQRQQDGAPAITLETLSQAEIVDARVFDNVAAVTVEFTSTQTRILTDEDGVTPKMRIPAHVSLSISGPLNVTSPG